MGLLAKLRERNPDCSAIAFIDDVSCFGRRSKVESYLARCVAEAKPYGLVVSVTKRSFWTCRTSPQRGCPRVSKGAFFLSQKGLRSWGTQSRADSGRQQVL